MTVKHIAISTALMYLHHLVRGCARAQSAHPASGGVAREHVSLIEDKGPAHVPRELFASDRS